MTVLTPSYFAEQYSPDDNRFDLRPFLNPVSDSWWPFKKIEESVEGYEASRRLQVNGVETDEDDDGDEVESEVDG